MDSKKPHRRPEFDELVSGWGSDNLDDLVARMELVRDYWRDHLPLSVAEHRIVLAMNKRLCALGGIEMPWVN